jgi:hypothetical protein
VLVTLVNVSLLLAALRDWQVYRLSGIGAALPVLPGAAGLLILVAVAVRAGQAGSRLPGPAGSRSPVVNRDDDRFWKGGLIYINRDDPAIMVGNRFGIGWTPNLGNHHRASRGPRSGRHMNRSPISRGSNPGISGATTTRPTSCATCSAWRLTGAHCLASATDQNPETPAGRGRRLRGAPRRGR